MGKVFTYPARQAAFERSMEALRKLFPNAKESFIRGQARSTARKVPAPEKAKVPRVRVSVAQTYRAPTRAERQEAHGNKMLWKREHRAGCPSRFEPLANLSRNHPDYGCTPAEHARRKAERLA